MTGKADLEAIEREQHGEEQVLTERKRLKNAVPLVGSQPMRLPQVKQTG